MTTPTQQATSEMVNTQGLADYAASLRQYARVDWAASIQEGLQQVTNAELSNDPAIVACFSELTEISNRIAAVADQIDDALADGHDQTTEQVTALGDRAANINTYKRH